VLPEATYVPTEEERRARAAAARAQLQSLAFRLLRAGVHVTCVAVEGMAPDTIRTFAAEHEVDLIVMGTHGRSGLSHLLLGSIAEQVVRSAPCPVLTIGRERRRAVTYVAAGSRM
jgi:nucleotide-binding universal stress UspA family protein